MRTTLELDDNLLETLLARLPGRSKTEAIEVALRGYLATDAISRLREIAGSVDIEDVSQELRAADRHT
ncbi:MAG: type II toxin-antitoxin system VapB family antitoxin [Thermoleophilaceae bacterium]|jgi:hypothetical protein